MDNKIIIGAVVVIAVAVAALAVEMTYNDGVDESKFVNYRGNGAKTTNGDTVVHSSTTEVLSGGVFDDTDKTLILWNTKADGSGKYYAPHSEAALGTSLYAIWGDHSLNATSLYLVPSGVSLGLSDDITGEGKVRDIGYPCGLSNSGDSTIILYGWNTVEKLNDHAFKGTVAGSTSVYTLELSFKGTDSYTLSVNGTYAYINFTYSNDVTISAILMSS